MKTKREISEKPEIPVKGISSIWLPHGNLISTCAWLLINNSHFDLRSDLVIVLLSSDNRRLTQERLYPVSLERLCWFRLWILRRYSNTIASSHTSIDWWGLATKYFKYMNRQEAEIILQRTFKLSRFYDEQWTTIDKILKGERVLLIEKTGFGKSVSSLYKFTQIV